MQCLVHILSLTHKGPGGSSSSCCTEQTRPSDPRLLPRVAEMDSRDLMGACGVSSERDGLQPGSREWNHINACRGGLRVAGGVRSIPHTPGAGTHFVLHVYVMHNGIRVLIFSDARQIYETQLRGVER